MRLRYETAEGIDADALWRATGQFLHDYAAWTWWATLTFEAEISECAAASAFKAWVQKIAREVVRAHVPVGWAWELQRRGLPAYHALLAIDLQDRRFTARVAHALWKTIHPVAGFTRIERFDASRGAAWYEAAHPEWDVNVACSRPRACRRAKGCVQAPGPW